MQISKEDAVQIRVTAAVSGLPVKDIQDIKAPELSFSSKRSSAYANPNSAAPPRAAIESSFLSVSSNQDELVHQLEEGSVDDVFEITPQPLRKFSTTNPPSLNIASRFNSVSSQKIYHKDFDNEFIEITPLSSIPFFKITQFTGRISLHFIKETHLSLDNDAMSGMGGSFSS